MEGKCFVICDREQAYADGLALVLADKIDFQIHVCSSVEQVKLVAKEKSIKILLVEEYFAEEMCLGMDAEEMIILVNETMAAVKGKAIYKYQSVDAILAEILEICLEDHHSGILKKKLYKDSCLIGVYSPIHRIGKTTFAVMLGRELAEKERVLYLNMEEYSGWRERYPQNGQYTLADLLYYARQEKGNLELRLGMMAEHLGKLEYIAPIYISEDLKRVTFEEWRDLLEQLLNLKIYKKIIIDFGESVQGLWELLKLCQRIYMPVNREQESEAKIAQFEKNAEILGYGTVFHQMIRLEFEGDMERYTRQLMQKEDEENGAGRAAS